jgi:hypothetical protein
MPIASSFWLLALQLLDDVATEGQVPKIGPTPLV